MKAVFLDVDDTLVDYQYAARAAFAEAVGADADYDVFIALPHYERFLAGEVDFLTYREERMRDFLIGAGREADAANHAELERVRFETLPLRYRLFDDALPALAMLRERGLAVGLITNNESVHQRHKLAAVGLDTLVDAVVISGEVGVAKPDARIFDHACRALGVAPSEAVHVGDNLDADALGAHAAGLRAVWLDRAGRHDGSPLDVAVIASLRELSPLLD